MDSTVNKGEVSPAIERSRGLTLLGNYDEALATLDAAEGEPDTLDDVRVRLYREAARVLMARGFPIAAMECLDKASELATRCLNGTELLSLNLQRAYVSMAGRGDEDTDEGPIKDTELYLDSLEFSGADAGIDEETVSYPYHYSIDCDS